MLAQLGRWIIDKAYHFWATFRLLVAVAQALPVVLKNRNRPIAAVFLKQVYFTGFESLKVILPISMAIGTVIIAQIINLVGVGNESLTAKVLIWTVVRELGPLLTALIVIARSGAAIATELGNMKINGEIEAIAALGIPTEQYLVLPRVLGVTLAVFALTVYFETGAIVGGFLVGSLGWHVPFGQFAQGMYVALTLPELALSAGKSLLFGLLVSAICCEQGFSVGRSATMVPQAATKGVMFSLFTVFFLDGIITLLWQLV